MNRIKDEKLLKLYSEGLTNHEIAVTLGVTQPAVHYRLQKLGLHNNCHEKQVIETEKVKQLHDMGLTTVGIALLLETSVLVISQDLQYMGLQDNYYRLKESVESV
ncbi:MAG: response regulator transcription factor [Theionarchaea archaeon]|nr:response regulator transcription factor [Theionarchaea archaeon]